MDWTISQTSSRNSLTVMQEVFSVFSVVYRPWAGQGPPTGLQSQTGGWRGRAPACGSAPPWRWCGSSRRCRRWCSTAPTRRPPPAAWWARLSRRPQWLRQSLEGTQRFSWSYVKKLIKHIFHEYDLKFSSHWSVPPWIHDWFWIFLQSKITDFLGLL